MIESRCGHCAYWDSRDGLVGFCPEITNSLRLRLDVLAHGLAPCRTSASGRCKRFEAVVGTRAGVRACAVAEARAGARPMARDAEQERLHCDRPPPGRVYASPLLLA